MSLKAQPLSVKIGLFFLGLSAVILTYGYTVRSDESAPATVEVSTPVAAPKTLRMEKPEYVRGIHMTAWAAGSKKFRAKIDPLLKDTELNAVVIAIKEDEGGIHIPGVPLAEKHKTYQNAIPDLKEYLARLKSEGVYPIARVVVFKDNILPRKRLDLAVKRPDGTLWTDRRNITWLDPYNREVWDYIVSVSTQAATLGFEEIQFDYIRFPSDGDTKQCRYSYAQHNSSSSARALSEFLEYSSAKLKPLGIKLSIDIFGLTPSVKHDMGIGQKIMEMTRWVDYVSPMTYPSHYAKGEYGIPNPNQEPYRVVYKTMSDAKLRLGDMAMRLRPYLQDFSMGHKYGPKEVRAQIEACEDLGFKEWLLWNASGNYTKSALRSNDGTLSDAAKVPASWKPVQKSTNTATALNTKPSSSTAPSQEPAVPEPQTNGKP